MAKSKLPILSSVGMTRENDAFVCYILKTQGNKVIEKKILELPNNDEALRQVKIEVIKAFWKINE